jgi:general secretion pathway protein E
MSDSVLRSFEAFLARPNGIVLVTGPTGSGKTTTLYAALSRLSTSRENIMTVEDPVEYEMPGISQTPVSPKIGLTFASALRAILRQDPDILMIGEIRDIETAQIAVQAALTGHLVLATLHTNDAASAVTRLLDMGIEPFLLSSTLHGVIGQRLVRQLCDGCKRQVSGSLFEASTLGCPQCNSTGYRGRLGVYELMAGTSNIQAAIKRGADAPEIRRLARQEGLVEMAEDASRWLAQGRTSQQEVARVVLRDSA